MILILDSNAWSEDKWLRSNALKRALAYVKRTRSSLVLPDLILEEVLGVYRRKLAAKTQEAMSKTQDAFRFHITNTLPPTIKIDVELQVNALRNNLMNPTPGLKSTLYEVGSIDLREVFARATNRRRPASETGEELRDVVIWLAVLNYAQEHKGEPVAFVSRDGGFWRSESEVHPDILEDVATRKLKVRLYPDLNRFNADHPLESRDVTPEEINRVLDPKLFDEPVIEGVKLSPKDKSLEHLIQFKSISVSNRRLAAGKAYRVDTHVEVLELAYFASLELTASSPQKDFWGHITNLLLLLSSHQPDAPISVTDSGVAVRADIEAQVSVRLIDGLPEGAEIDSLKPIKMEPSWLGGFLSAVEPLSAAIKRK